MKTAESYINEPQEHITGLGVDRFGRKIGVLIKRITSTFTPTTNSYYSTMAPGVYYAFQPHSTRDEATYGASQQYRYFKSLEEREKAIVKYIKDKCKREKAAIK
jgi:hypothetical protein